MEGRYLKYYLNQGGRGLSDIGVLHRGPLYYQRGHGGVGSFFSTLFRTLHPLLNVLKDQSIKTGSAILRDIGQKPIKDVLKEQGAIALQDLTERGVNKLKRTMQAGKGIKRRGMSLKTQLLLKRFKRNVGKKRGVQKGGKKKRITKRSKRRISVKRKRTLDIFD